MWFAISSEEKLNNWTVHFDLEFSSVQGSRNVCERLKVRHSLSNLTCVASVSVEQRAKNGVFGVLPARKMGREQKRKEGVGEGSEGNACGQTPWFWKPPFASKWSSWLAALVKHYWHVPIKGLKVPSAGKKVRSLFTKSVNFPHGNSI